MAVVPSAMITSSSHSHVCPYKDCRKAFSKKYNLKAHLRMHTGEMPFTCSRPGCSKRFKWRSSLSSHTVWHKRQDNIGNKQAGECHTNKETSKQQQVEESGKKKYEAKQKKRPRTGMDHSQKRTCSIPRQGPGKSEAALIITGKRGFHQMSTALIPGNIRPQVKKEVAETPAARPLEKKIKTELKARALALPSVSLPTQPRVLYRPAAETKPPICAFDLTKVNTPVQETESKTSTMMLPSKSPLMTFKAEPGSPVLSDSASNFSETSLDSLDSLPFFDDLNDAVYDRHSITTPSFAKEEAPISQDILAQCISPTCAAIDPMDHEFNDFELESLQSFYAKEVKV